MFLERWLAENAIRRNKFAASVGVVPSYVTALCNGEIWPSRAVMRRIVAATDGAVGPQDFLDQDREGEAA